MSTFAKDLLDLDAYLNQGKKWPSLKLVFDNLRCYPILALMGIAMRSLGKSPEIAATVAFWFLLPIMIFLLLATLVQTSVLLSVLAIGIVSSYVRPRISSPEVLLNAKWFKVLVGAVLGALAVVSFVAAVSLFRVLSRFQIGG